MGQGTVILVRWKKLKGHYHQLIIVGNWYGCIAFIGRFDADIKGTVQRDFSTPVFFTKRLSWFQ